MIPRQLAVLGAAALALLAIPAESVAQDERPAFVWAFKAPELSLNPHIRINVYCADVFDDPASGLPQPPPPSHAPVTVTVRQGGTARIATLSDPCGGFWDRQKALAKWWGLWPRGGGDSHAVDIDINHVGRRTLRMHFSVRQADATLATGRFKMRAVVHHGGRIWEGTDAFVNTCINDGRIIYSSGGRLYCETYRHVSTATWDFHWQRGGVTVK